MIYAVILNFGDSNITKKCIANLKTIETEKFEIVVVNNNIDSLSPQYFKQKLTVINNHKNLGFAGGVNVGISYALKKRADYIFLLNNDTFLKKPILHNLREFLYNSKDLGIVGPAIQYIKNGKNVYDVGGSVSWFGRTSHKEVRDLKKENPHEVTYVSGCCMLVRSDVFKKIGLFDANFFLYYEDVDFCLRARNMGFKTYVMPMEIIHHELSKTIGKLNSNAVFHQTRSAAIFGKKYFNGRRLYNIIFILSQTLLLILKRPSNTKKLLFALRFVF